VLYKTKPPDTLGVLLGSGKVAQVGEVTVLVVVLVFFRVFRGLRTFLTVSVFTSATGVAVEATVTGVSVTAGATTVSASVAAFWARAFFFIHNRLRGFITFSPLYYIVHLNENPTPQRVRFKNEDKIFKKNDLRH
jgi:hypothetical protein